METIKSKLLELKQKYGNNFKRMFERNAAYSRWKKAIMSTRYKGNWIYLETLD